MSSQPKRMTSPEQISEDPRFQPYHVVIPVIYSSLDIEPTPVHIFVRALANNPGKASMDAYQLWNRWERVDKGLGEFDRYPEVGEHGAVVLLDENDYRSMWKSMFSVPNPKYAGPRANPTGFLFEKGPYSVIKS